MTEELVKHASPYSDTEQKLIEIWMEVLQISIVAVNDQFLDLGGDSLHAMSCISRLRSKFGIEFGIEEFFWDQATISEFAAAIDQSQTISSSQVGSGIGSVR